MKQIINIDASGLVQSSCWLRAKRIMLDGYSDALPYNDTLYGSAFHMFQAEMFRTNGNFALATDAALKLFSKPKQIRGNKKFLDEHHLIKTCHDSWLNYTSKDNFQVFSVDGKPLVEIEFSIPYRETDDYIVNLCGTIDKFGQFPGGVYAIGDYKTHSLSSMVRKAKEKGDPYIYIKSEIDMYFIQYELSLQFRFYIFCLKLLASKSPDGELARICNTQIGYFIDGVFISSTEPTRFQRSKIVIPKSEFFVNFQKHLDRKVDQMIWLSQHPEYDEMDGILHGACNELRFACKFSTICAADSDVAREFLLKENFIKKQYDPLQFSK